MPTFDEAMTNLRSAIEANRAKAVADALAAQPAPVDTSERDAAAVQALADELNPPG